MTEYHWNQLYDRGSDLFHEPPGRLEPDIVQAFQQNPRRVKNEIEKLGSQILNGADIRSGWAILRKRLAQTPDDVVAVDSTSRESAILNARRWIHNAGLHYDRETDVLEELFDQQGILHEFDSDHLRAEMAQAWRQERPRGEQAEQEHEAYMARVKEQRLRLERPPTPPTEPEWQETPLEPPADIVQAAKALDEMVY